MRAHRAYLTATLGAMIGLAWLALWRLDASPYGRYLHLPTNGSVHTYHHAAAVSPFVAGSAFVGGWMLMVIAMMLPTTLPLVDIFRRLTAERPDRSALISLLLGGYLLAWGAFGLAAYGSVSALETARERSAWLVENGWVVGVLLLVGAGAFQFSDLKHRCLEKCRSPLMFIMERWRGRRERWHAFRLGLDHGAFCIGCCWALMLLMLGVSTASLAWMLALGSVMAIEKNVPAGRWMTKPLGLLLIAGGALTLAYHLVVVRQ